METPITDPTVILGGQLYVARFDFESRFKLEQIGIGEAAIPGLITNMKDNPVSNITTLASACLFTVPGDEMITLTPKEIAKMMSRAEGSTQEKFALVAKPLLEAYTKARLADAAAAKANEPTPQPVQ